MRNLTSPASCYITDVCDASLETSVKMLHVNAGRKPLLHRTLKLSTYNCLQFTTVKHRRNMAMHLK